LAVEFSTDSIEHRSGPRDRAVTEPNDGLALPAVGRASLAATRRLAAELRPPAQSRRVLSRAITGLAGLTLLLAFGLFGTRLAFDARIYPGVAVAGVGVGGMERDEARALVEQEAAELERGLVYFTYGDRVWAPTLSELGARVDVEATLDAAFAIGREDDARDRVGSTWDLVGGDRVVPLQITLDYAALGAWFDRVDGELGIAPHDAYLVIKGLDVRIESAVEGTVVDRLAATARIEHALATLKTAGGALPTTPWIPRVHAEDLAAAQEQVEAALAEPVKVRFDGATWSIKPEDLAPFIVQEVSPDPQVSGPAAVILRVDESALASWLNSRFAEEVNRPPVDAEVGWGSDQTVVAVTESVDGYQLRPKTFARAIQTSLFGDHETVDVPVSVVKPDVDSNNLDALGITTQLVRANSNYSGGTPERTNNVQVGAALLNGTLIPPHGEFSFNHAIGEITAEKGYVEASVVQAERAGRDIGGGICQISTTVFRAAIFAGLPITEWWPHTYRIGHYEWDDWGPGYDASILQPEGDPFGGGDFKFLNPSDSWMLVESWTDGIFVIVNIYGEDLGYRVETSETLVEGPIEERADVEVVNYELDPGTIIQTEYPIDGWAVSFTRDVYDRDGNLIESREFYTRFKGRGNVYQVSPDMAGQSPAA
jgi:vancomycin resistance protein YoaR